MLTFKEQWRHEAEELERQAMWLEERGMVASAEYLGLRARAKHLRKCAAE